MKDILLKFGFSPDNSIVIGSGILQALGIRESHDIDIVTNPETYNVLKSSGKFEVSKSQGREILVGNNFEIGTIWKVLSKTYELEDLKAESEVIEGVRYISLDLLYRVKKSWITKGSVRPKDLADINLIETYFQSNK